MSDYRKLLTSFMQKAQGIKNIEPPNHLLDIVNTAKLTAPFSFNEDSINNCFDSLQIYYGFIFNSIHTSIELTEQQKNQFINLIVWFLRSLEKWKKNHDLEYRELAALLIVSSYLDVDGCFWKVLPSNLKISTELLEELQQLILKFKSNFSDRENIETPIWERETVEQFKNAVSNGECLLISELWVRFESSLIPNVFQTQMVKFLAKFNFSLLCDALIDYKDIPILLMHTMHGLTIKQALSLGAESDNTYVEFTAVFGALSRLEKSRTLDEDDENKLVSIFRKVSQDTIRFREWMDIFNKHPIRYPSLQRALGLFLACHGQEASIDSYINSISLSSTTNQSRNLVTTCLNVFKNNADIKTRTILWRKAFNRWEIWKFNTDIQDLGLFNVGVSELDFALVGYYLECVPANDRIAYQLTIINQMNSIRSKWHGSITNCVTYWNLLVSQLQPVTHAINIENSNESWLMENKYFMPEPFNNSSYIDMSFRA